MVYTGAPLSQMPSLPQPNLTGSTTPRSRTGARDGATAGASVGVPVSAQATEPVGTGALAAVQAGADMGQDLVVISAPADDAAEAHEGETASSSSCIPGPSTPTPATIAGPSEPVMAGPEEIFSEIMVY